MRFISNVIVPLDHVVEAVLPVHGDQRLENQGYHNWMQKGFMLQHADLDLPGRLWSTLCLTQPKKRRMILSGLPCKQRAKELML